MVFDIENPEEDYDPVSCVRNLGIHHALPYPAAIPYSVLLKKYYNGLNLFDLSFDLSFNFGSM